MKRTAYLFAIAVLFFNVSCKKDTANATSDIEWSKIFGGSGLEVAYGAAESRDGSGFIIVGYTNSNDGDIQGKNHCALHKNIDKDIKVCGGDDGWVLKINRSGNLLENAWQNTYGGAPLLPSKHTFSVFRSCCYDTLIVYEQNSDRFTSVATTSNGHYLIAGQTNAWINEPIIKERIDTGVTLGPNSLRFRLYNSFPYNPTNAWITSINENGTADWETIMHDSWYDSVNCIKALSNGRFAVVGMRDGSKIPTGLNRLSYYNNIRDGGSGEAFIITGDAASGKTNPKIFIGGTGYDKLNAVTQTSDGNLIAAGLTSSTDVDLSGIQNRGKNDLWVVQLNSDGSPVGWKSKTFGGGGDDIANAVTATSDGGFIVAGQTNSNDGDVRDNHSSNYDAWVIRFTNSGDTVWTKTYGGAFGDDMAQSIIQTADGGFVFAGQTSSNDGHVSGNHGHSDAWIVKIDKNGKILWQQTLGGSSADGATNVIATSDGGLLVTGYAFSNDGNVSRFLANGNLWVVKLSKQ